MHWLRIQLYQWLAPLFVPALDDCNKRNLEQFYKNQADFYQKQEVHMIAGRDWLESTKNDMNESRGDHAKMIERFDKLIELLERKL